MLDGRLGDAAVVVGPALLAAALCLVGITSRSLGFDESATAAIASQHGAALRHAIAHDGGNMAGYYVFVHALVSLFGRGLLVLRLPSAIAIAAVVAVTGMLGLRLFDRRTAVAAALLTAVTVSLVFWGQSARSYALMVAFVSASFLAFNALVDRRAEASARGGVADRR
ncbi:MAG: glycosyltransferase family 39 protein, partial [Solirubrobacterales bacterium]|nr:glycosyltransferase family 39 protein [Solirubrobacterales bacterium]